MSLTTSFSGGPGCGSPVGRQGGEQFLKLSAGGSVGNVMHEIGHVLGLWHVQSRADREYFIQIDLNNVEEGFQVNFSQTVMDGDDVGEYDFDSIMRYHAYAFARDPKKKTIYVPSGHEIGQRVT